MQELSLLYFSALPYSPPVAGVGSGGYRGLYSGRVGPLNASRRPQQLRPIEHPRTPALERIESAQIRGYCCVLYTHTRGFSGIEQTPGNVVTVSDIDFEQRENYEFRVAVIDKTCVKKLGP